MDTVDSFLAWHKKAQRSDWRTYFIGRSLAAYRGERHVTWTRRGDNPRFHHTPTDKAVEVDTIATFVWNLADDKHGYLLQRRNGDVFDYGYVKA